MEDSRTTRRWYIVVTMGRNAGFLALEVGKSASTDDGSGVVVRSVLVQPWV